MENREKFGGIVNRDEMRVEALVLICIPAERRAPHPVLCLDGAPRARSCVLMACPAPSLVS